MTEAERAPSPGTTDAGQRPVEARKSCDTEPLAGTVTVNDFAPVG